MSATVLLVVAIIGVVAFVAIAVGLGVVPLFGNQGSSQSNLQNNLRSIVQAQRTSVRGYGSKKEETIIQAAARDDQLKKVATSRQTLAKKLKSAQWRISPTFYRVLVVVVSVTTFALVSLKFNLLLRIISLTSGPILMGFLLNTAIHRRFTAFDRDYPPFLLSLVGLLKTGMNTLTALEAGAEGLEDGSLVRQEVYAMIERLRIGIGEDQAIGGFGEDIDHEEIELFVQALLLSRRVGGNLSDTLDRLATQVRKRQYFRQSAHSAISMQRGSIWMIVVILVFIMIYMSFVAPDLVFGAIADDFGWQVWQFGITVILLGMFWIRQVTKIRI